MKIGTYYYPEQWPRQQWQRDFDNIAKMGLQIVHMAEFAWFQMEPRPGEFQFEWLDHCLDLAKQRKLDVILCTPTASPPIWLAQSHPEILPVDHNGLMTRFGGRRHYNPLSPAMQDATRRIVWAMAERYGDHSSVTGWQIDNEYSGSFDQTEITHAAFRRWLRERYGDIHGVNRAWGNQFWNTYYTDFEQILMPRDRDPRYANPHQCLDASRFWSWAYAHFNHLQTEILKSRIGHRFLTTNFMPLHLDVNPGDMAKDLTLFAWDSYPIDPTQKGGEGENYRLADPAAVSFVHDQMASYKDRWGLLELQAGHVNWSMTPVQLYPGAVRLWIWTAFAHGAEFLTTYRFRQPRFGIEMHHHGLVETDGVTPSAGGKQFVQVIDELKKLDMKRVPAWKDEKPDPKEAVGLVFDFDQLWYLNTMPQARRWSQARWLHLWYAALSRLGKRIMILRPGARWPRDLPLIVAPAVQMVDEDLILDLAGYASGGGNLVLTCRTAWMDRTGQFWEGPIAKPILPLIGATIPSYDGLREDCFGKIDFEGSKYDWGVWGEQISPAADTQVLATYADQFYAGAAAITQRKMDQGTISYFGVFSEPPLVDAFVESLAKKIGLIKKDALLPTRVQVLRRGPYRIALNYNARQISLNVPRSAKFLIGSASLGPAGVAVWEE
jgi:beta-galactosidase